MKRPLALVISCEELPPATVMDAVEDPFGSVGSLESFMLTASPRVVGVPTER
ncbi:hypothetical protein FRUB_10055 [Fimbriiglobus ruber]|uniref:Uncharacterized protein n=1 Tax=Fimbriiglobus ruber TaxID=1908690 RepID=A0A225D2N8_9BACT|nr:hypothetical protein FRUB_10055 [Fimbriiglobus ruber]